MTVIEGESFGFLYGPAPRAELTLDSRDYLRDPARINDAGLLDATGHDEAVRAVVLGTDGADAAIATLVMFGSTFPAGRGPCRIAVGCAGGRHRSVVLLEKAAEILRQAGHTVTIRHRDEHRDRVLTNDER